MIHLRAVGVSSRLTIDSRFERILRALSIENQLRRLSRPSYIAAHGEGSSKKAAFCSTTAIQNRIVKRGFSWRTGRAGQNRKLKKPRASSEAPGLHWGDYLDTGKVFLRG
jgi:hypothetical protein